MRLIDKLNQSLQLKNHDELRAALDLIYQHVVSTDSAYKNALEKLEEKDKESEIYELKKELCKLRRKISSEFVITEEEEHLINIWHAGHVREKHNANLNVLLEYTFSPTGLGLHKKCTCSKCGESFIFGEITG